MDNDTTSAVRLQYRDKSTGVMVDVKDDRGAVIIFPNKAAAELWADQHRIPGVAFTYRQAFGHLRSG